MLLTSDKITRSKILGNRIFLLLLFISHNTIIKNDTMITDVPFKHKVHYSYQRDLSF